MKKNVDMHGKLGYNIITFEVNEKSSRLKGSIQ